MIINVRGTSGSGKSTVMNRVMIMLGDWNGIYREGRKQPEYYRHTELDLAVLGHYASPCGGCDTIGSAAAVYQLTQRVKAKTILCEGLLLSEDTKWSFQLPDLRVVFLTTPLQQCLRQIEGRRAAVGNVKPLNPTNTANRVRTIERARQKLVTAGVTCVQADCALAERIILQWVRNSTSTRSAGS